MSDIHDLIATCPNKDYMHIIICEDGLLIPMTFVKPNDADIAWAKEMVKSIIPKGERDE